MKIKMILTLLLIMNAVNYGQERADTTQLPYNFNFGLLVGPAFNGADFNATIYNIDETYGTYWLKSISAYAGLDYYFEEINQYFIKDLYLYSKFGFESVSGTNEKDVIAGYNFFNNTLEQTTLRNTLTTSLLFSNLSFGAKASTSIENLSLFMGLNFGILISKNLELNSILTDNSIEVIDPLESINFSDNLGAMQLGVNLGANYKIFKAKDSSYSIDAVFNAKFGINNLIDLEQNGSSKSFGSNSIGIGIQINLHSKKSKDTIKTPIPDTVSTVKPFKIDYVVRNTNSDTRNIYADIIDVNSSYIIHPFIYYDDDVSDEPKQLYKMLSFVSQRTYTREREVNKYQYENYEDFYYDVLNQVAYEVYNKPNTQITIIYPPGITNIGESRAKYIKKYFSDIWNIGENKVKIISGSSAKNTIRIETNELNKPLECGTKKEYLITSDKLQFNVNYPANMNILNWDLRLQHFKNNGLKTVFETDDTRKIESIEVNIKDNTEMVLSNTNHLEYVFKLKKSDGIKDYLGKIGIIFNNNSNEYQKLYGKIADLRNNIDNPKRIFANKTEIEIYTTMESTANEIANIIGVRNFTFKKIDQKNDIIFSDYFMIKYK